MPIEEEEEAMAKDEGESKVGGGGGGARKVVFGRYEMGRVLGQGNFSKVYYGRDLESEEGVAVKVISKEQVRREGAGGLMEQIQREISVMRLVRHPNVVELKQVLATRSRIFFVMEYVRGGELFARVSRGRLPEDQARKYFQQLISAVDFCHSRGVSHRDLKPENLLLDEKGDLKVSDFGLSALPEQLWQDGLLHTQCGTPAYVAPEVLGRKGYDGDKADVWSCGVILFVLLAGFLPFQDENLMRMYRKVLKAEYSAPPWFSPAARRLVAQLLVPDPCKRMTIAGILEVAWFKKGFSRPLAFSIPIPSSDKKMAMMMEEVEVEEGESSPRSYNAFELISTLSSGFDLSGLFESRRTKRTVFTSRRPGEAIMEALEKVGRRLGFDVERAKKRCRMRMEGRKDGRKGKLALTAEVFEVAPQVAVVEFCRNSGDTFEYVKFCEEDVRPGLKDVVWAWQGDYDDDDDHRCNAGKS
ncbi:putative CBL-interacting protein kinase 16 [Iris pallida]|uniref:non-specific serine/threonine protein kinase n=1 Tax=Iris pallida TaxID=29817 RepID=A0AAX6II79_IRIPA|nr:putative CBL-interacting protein kinase 16 [Iris pallida]